MYEDTKRISDRSSRKRSLTVHILTTASKQNVLRCWIDMNFVTTTFSNEEMKHPLTQSTDTRMF
jgi:hypothetical protein